MPSAHNGWGGCNCESFSPAERDQQPKAKASEGLKLTCLSVCSGQGEFLRLRSSQAWSPEAAARKISISGGACCSALRILTLEGHVMERGPRTKGVRVILFPAVYNFLGLHKSTQHVFSCITEHSIFNTHVKSVAPRQKQFFRFYGKKG